MHKMSTTLQDKKEEAMKKLLMMAALTGVTLWGAMPAHAAVYTYTLPDEYIGSSGPDAILGAPYDITQTIVHIDQTSITFDFYSADDGGYFTEGILRYGMGDLFLDTTGGTTWNYVVELNNPVANNTFIQSSGIATLYVADPDMIQNGSVRLDEAALYDPSGQSPVGSAGSWEIKSTDDWTYNYLSITMPLALAGWNGTSPLGFHWTMACGNDVVQDVVRPIPEPATMLLFGTGILGLAGIMRRRTQP